MTDNEIIKVLEGCKCDTLELALDLINRQKAEIERLNVMVAAAEEHLYPLPFKTAYDEEIQQAKTEAIREFAERLKDEAVEAISCNTFTKVVCKSDIDDILREMVGDGS